MLIIFRRVGDLRFGTFQTAPDGFLILGTAVAQAALQFLHVRRQDEDRRGSRIHLLDVAGAFHFDNENHRNSALHAGFNFAAQRTVVVAAVLGVFHNLIVGQVILEISHRHKVVIDAVLFPLTRSSGCG